MFIFFQCAAALKTQFALLHYLPSWFPQRWEILWISTFATLCVSLGGEGLYEAVKLPWQQDGEVTLECTWIGDHKRMKIAELKDCSWELPPSIPQAPQSCAAVLADPSCRADKSRKRCSDAPEVEWTALSFPRSRSKPPCLTEHRAHSWEGWGYSLCSPNPNSPDHSLSQASWRGNGREEEDPG